MFVRLYLIEVVLLNSYLLDAQIEQTSSIPETDSPQEQPTDQSTDKPEQDIFMPNTTTTTTTAINRAFIEKTKNIQIIPLNRQKLQLKQLNNSAEYYNQKLSK